MRSRDLLGPERYDELPLALPGTRGLDLRPVEVAERRAGVASRETALAAVTA